MAGTTCEQSRLLSLPGEIRNRIYRLVAVHQEPVQVPRCPWSKGDVTFRPKFPRLGLTCRTILDEIKAIFYEENTFSFTEYALRPKPMQAFRDRAGKSADKLTTIKINRAIGIGRFGCSIRFTAKLTDGTVHLINFSDDYVNGIRGHSRLKANGVNGMCHCLAAAIAEECEGSLLDFVDNYLSSDRTTTQGTRCKLILGICEQCQKYRIESIKIVARSGTDDGESG